MFRILLKDLRISPIRTFLTGFSMFIGIIAMIAAVLVGTLGRESLLSVNAQLFGRTPTYSLNLSGVNFENTEKAEKFSFIYYHFKFCIRCSTIKPFTFI